MLKLSRFLKPNIGLKPFQAVALPRRPIFSQTGTFDATLNEEKLKKIEEFWKQKLPQQVRDAQNRIESSKDGKPYFYVLSMFPYPSGQLHMGHVRVYAISDAMAHFYRMMGYNVLHPMGWDAFGLPAENAAIERGIEPEVWTRKNIESMRSQLEDLGCLFDWDREVATCDPEYYKWTQFIFTRMFEAGLAYRDEAMVNWDPVDKTVLADEQVDSDGRSWRSGAKVEKRTLRQWFLRTTQFSNDLFEGLSDPALSNWRDIVKIQQNWIGQCDGAKIEFPIKNGDEDLASKISIWTDRPELIFSSAAAFITSANVLYKDHLVQQEIYVKSLNGTVKKLSLSLTNPFNGENIPIFAYDANEVSENIYPKDSNSFLLFPDQSNLSKNITNELKLQAVSVISNESDNPTLQNSARFTGLPINEARDKILAHARDLKIGGHKTSSKLNDWLISRQRYWGTPIPIIHCENCGPVAVPEQDLPVELPKIDPGQFWSSRDSVGEKSPLALCHDWVSTSCPKCGGQAERETDTMDTFVDSAWYFFRYLDPRNQAEPFSLKAAESMPVDLYIGGKEHATLHLYYARFITRFLNQIGLSPIKEPFINLLVQGMVKGQSFRVKGTGKYLPKTSVDFSSGSKPVEAGTGLPLVIDWEKMSKSKHNGADPGQVIAKYGSDMTRLLILSDVSPLSDRNWSPEDSYIRINNMLNKLTRIIESAISLQKRENLPDLPNEKKQEENSKLWDARNFYVRGANNAYLHTKNLAMVMGRIQGFLGELSGVNSITKRDSPEFQRALGTVIILLTPLAPHLSAELWAAFTSVKKRNCEDFIWDKSVFHQEWPQLDPNYNLKLHVLRNEEPICDIPVAVWRFKDLVEEDALNLACGVNEIQDGVLREEFSTRFDKIDNYEATLNFVVNESQEERKRKREEKKKEKERKKAERQVRLETHGKPRKQTKMTS